MPEIVSYERVKDSKSNFVFGFFFRETEVAGRLSSAVFVYFFAALTNFFVNLKLFIGFLVVNNLVLMRTHGHKC